MCMYCENHVYVVHNTPNRTCDAARTLLKTYTLCVKNNIRYNNNDRTQNTFHLINDNNVRTHIHVQEIGKK